MIHFAIAKTSWTLGVIAFASLCAAFLAVFEGWQTLAGVGILALSGAIAPVILHRFTTKARVLERTEENKQRLIEKKEDWKRQDEVAERVAEAARLLVNNNKAVMQVVQQTSEQVAVVKTLVDGQMTTAIRESRDSKIAELAMLEELVADKRARGIKPSDGTLETIATIQSRIKELGTKIEDREKQESIVKEAGIETK